ncbi:unnamed protein product [Brassica rapa]|uniref:Uncharacterized protein n=1 Tax=Brassica campestris TaxID=3711 RepID=A0A8D9DI41_BRACM|nr:unnamed protein product [Brassica rapa]
MLSPRTSVLICVLMDSHGRPVCQDRVLHKQSPGRASVLSPRTNVLICVLMDNHGRPVCADGHTRTHTDSHGCPVCANRHPRTSYSPRGPKSLEQSSGRANMLSPRTSVLICVLIDSHGRPVCADGHTQTSSTDVLCVLADPHRHPVQPTWAKITRTVHGKGQHAESKDQRADLCTDGQPRTSCSTRRASVLSPRTNVLICILMNSHRRPVCADAHTWTATDPTWAKITQTVPRKGQRAESKDQRADMCTDGQPRTSCVC